MLSLSRPLVCLVVCAATACGFESGGVTEDSGTGDETATETAADTAGTEDEVGTQDTGTEAADEAVSEEETGGGANCGNGMIEQGEPCDGEDLDGQTCMDLGFLGGELMCSGNCTIDATGCVNQLCGNGVLEEPEECDTFDFGGLNCVDLGFGPGLPLCTEECTLDTSPCETLGEGEGCSNFDPCPNDLNCVSGTCYNGSKDDPCENDGDCQSNDCVGRTLFEDGVCA